MRIPIVLLTSLALVPVTGHSLVAQQEGFSDLVVEHLRLDLVLDHDHRRLSGTATLRIRNLADLAVRRAPFLLGRLMTVDAVSDAAGPLRFEGDVLRFPDWQELQVLETWTELRAPLQPGATTEITIDYQGTVVGYTESGMSYVRDHVAPEFTLIRSDAFSFPTLGTASLESMRGRRRHDFTFGGTVSVADETLIVASAGHDGVERANDGRSIWSFTSPGPAPFLLLAVAEYEVVETPVAKIYHFPADQTGAARLLEALTRAKELYGDWFGRRAGSRPVVIMEIPEGWGSQASLAGGIIQTAAAFLDGDQLPQLYHEVAHLWHPPEIERPADRWNEGFATFLQWRVAHHDEPDALARQMERISTRLLSQDIDSLPPMEQYGETDQTGLAYRVGPLFFYLLYESLGGREFDRCLGAFFSEFGTSGSTSEDFAESVRSCGFSAAAAVNEWFSTTEGLRRLRAGATLADLTQSYKTASSTQR